MGVLDLVAQPTQRVAYLFPEIATIGGGSVAQTGDVTSKNPDDGPGQALGINPSLSALNDVFVFQFWPQQISDRYQTNYSTKAIPGLSHPLYQWVGGGGRTISFDATFVTEIAEDAPFTATSSFNEQVAQNAALGSVGATASSAITAAFLPSSRYVINVSAALAALQRYLCGTYPAVGQAKAGLIIPPKKVVLVLPGTNIGRLQGNDSILCILKSADVTMESFFPSGEIRAATVSLEFAEIIQSTTGQGTRIRPIGAEAYAGLASRYLLTGVKPAGLSV